MPPPLCSTPKSYAALLTVLESCSEEELSMEYIKKKFRNTKGEYKYLLWIRGQVKSTNFVPGNFFSLKKSKTGVNINNDHSGKQKFLKSVDTRQHTLHTSSTRSTTLNNVNLKGSMPNKNVFNGKRVQVKNVFGNKTSLKLYPSSTTNDFMAIFQVHLG